MASLIRTWKLGLVLGMVASSSLAQTEPVPLPGPQMANGLASRPLLMEPVIQKEIGLSDKQRSRMEQIENEASQVNQPAVDPEAEEGFDFNTMVGAVEVTAREKQAAINKVLTAPQKTRLQQIEYQRQGWLALGRPEVAKRIKLSQPQLKKIQAVVSQMRQAQSQVLLAPVAPLNIAPDSKTMKNLNPGNGFKDKSGAFNAENGPMTFNAEANQARAEKSVAAFDQVSANSAKDVDAILTPEQKAAFVQLLGPTFNFGLLNGTDILPAAESPQATSKVSKQAPKKAVKKR